MPPLPVQKAKRSSYTVGTDRPSLRQGIPKEGSMKPLLERSPYPKALDKKR